jgi:hypothetical protein
MIAMTTQKVTMNNSANKTESMEGKMVDIQALSSQVEQLKGSVGWWNTWVVRLLVVTAIILGLTFVVGVVYAAFSKIALSRADALANAQTELSRAKDEQLARDLKAKDLLISAADQKAGEANKEAGKANQKAGEANERASVADEAAGKANERAGELEKGAAEARLKQEELKEQNLATELRLEEEKTTRLELEKSLAPRTILLTLPPGRIPLEIIGSGMTVITKSGESNLDPLKQFAGQPVVVQFLPDAEARRATRQLLTMFEVVGWKVISVTPNPELEHPYFDGVVVEPYRPPRLSNLSSQQLMEEMENNKKLSEPTTALVKLLRDSDWTARHGAGLGTDQIPPGSIRVSVGFKPPPLNTGSVSRGTEALIGSAKKPVQPERTKRRHIEGFQRDVIDKRMVEFPLLNSQTTPLEIRCPADNKEACEFAEEILSILQSHKWPISGNAVIRDRSFPRRLSGLVIHDPMNEGSFPAAGLLYDAFRYGSLTPELDRDTQGAKSDPIRIMVGW